MPSAKTILIVEIDRRRAVASSAQHIMTEYGCVIKTRLGIHDGVVDQCSDRGLIILELVGPKKDRQALQGELNALAGVKTKAVDFPL